jgi:hypothetical protein
MNFIALKIFFEESLYDDLEWAYPAAFREANHRKGLTHYGLFDAETGAVWNN